MPEYNVTAVNWKGLGKPARPQGRKCDQTYRCRVRKLLPSNSS